MKIAVIGAGNWGKNLVRNLSQLGVLSDVAEASQALRDGIAADYPGVTLHSDFNSLLDADVDAVAIATPVPTHHAIAKAFLLAGKDVFVEKPMTFTVEEAEDLIKVASENNRVLMVGHLLLYQPAVQWLRSYLTEGKLGKIYSLHQRRAKLGRARSVENALWSLGVHDVAVLLHLVGEAPQKTTFVGHCGLQESIEDDTYLHMEFSGGVLAHLHNSWLWPENQRGLTVVGERGMIIYNEVEQTLTLHRKTIDSDLNNVDEGEELLFKGDGQPLLLEMEHFLECLKTRATPRSDGQNGLDVIRVLASCT